MFPIMDISCNVEVKGGELTVDLSYYEKGIKTNRKEEKRESKKYLKIC